MSVFSTVYVFQPVSSDVVPDICIDADTTTTTTMLPPQPAQKARRPTTLAYCERTVSLPRVRHPKLPSDVSRRVPPATSDQPKAAVVTVAADVVAVPVVPLRMTRVVAPTATPEDSFVEGGSSSCGLELEALPPGESIAAAAAQSTAANALTDSGAAQRPHVADDDRRTLATSCLDSQSIQEVVRLSTTDAPTQQSLPATQRRAAVRQIHRVIAGARQRLLRQLAHRAVADEKSTATTAFSDEDRASAVDDSASASTSSRSLLAVTGCPSVVAGVAPIAAVEVDVCSSVGSSTAALSDTETLAADVSLVLGGGRRISPGSPSYDEKHSRFSHVGAHALDVFFSPEDLDDDDDDFAMSDRSDSGRAATSGSSLWRPLASRSGNLQHQSSAASTSLNVPTCSVAFAEHVTSGARLPEALCVGYDGAVSVQGSIGDVVRSTSSVLAVLSPTEACGSSMLATSDNCVAASTNYDESRLDVSNLRFDDALLVLVM